MIRKWTRNVIPDNLLVSPSKEFDEDVYDTLHASHHRLNESYQL